MHYKALLVLLLALPLAASSAAAKQRPAWACPAAQYVVDDAEPLGPGGIPILPDVPAFPDVVEIDSDGNISVESSCLVTRGKTKRGGDGSKLKAKWGKKQCDALEGKVKLKVAADATCETLSGTFKAKKHKRKFTATRPPSVTPELEPAQRVAATIGPEGGSISAEGTDGVFYTLEIPELALLEDTEVALTPVAAIPDLPFSGGLAGGVEFEPDGLALLRMATLRIEVPGGFVPPAGTQLVGFGSRGGQGFHARFAQDEGDAITVPIRHFSGGGAAAAQPEEVSELAEASFPIVEDLNNRAVEAATQGDPDGTTTVLRDAYDLEVRPRLVAAVIADVRLESAIPYFHGWLLMHFLQAGLSLPDRLNDGLTLAAQALELGVTRANGRCATSGDPLDEAAAALRWQRIAESLFALGVRGVPEGLQRQRVLEALCVQVAFEELRFPAEPVEGEENELVVKAGYSVASGRTILPDFQPMAITVEGIRGVTDTNPATFTGAADDELGIAFTPTDVGNIKIDVKACLASPRQLEDVCTQRSVTRGVTLFVPEDFATIQQAVDAADPGNFTIIRVAAGDFDGFTISTSRVRVVGVRGMRILGDVRVQNAVGVELRRLRVRGSIDIANSDDITVRDSGVSRGGSIFVQGGGGHKILNNEVKDSETFGIFVRATDFTLFQNKIIDASSVGIDVTRVLPGPGFVGPPGVAKLEGNEVRGGAVIGAILVHGDSVQVIKNLLKDVKDYGIRMEGFNHRISGNEVLGGDNGIQCDNGGNHVFDDNLVKRARDGFELAENCAGNQLIGNKVEEMESDGIDIEGFGNIVIGNDVMGTKKAGIEVGGGGNVVLQNKIRGGNPAIREERDRANAIFLNDCGNKKNAGACK